MAMTNRLLAPVAAPPPPKPPQLNLVASSLMPDVDTDTLGPAATTNLVSSGALEVRRDADTDRLIFDRPPGATGYAVAAAQHNALVAAFSTMADVDGGAIQQAEQQAGVTPDSLPVSLHPATSSKSRWVGGFAYAPENQYPGNLADTFSQVADTSVLSSPNGLTIPTTVAATFATTGGSLTHANSYSYVVTAVNALGAETAASLASTSGSPASGATGTGTVTWASEASAATFNVYRSVNGGAFGFIASVAGGTYTYTDTGATTASYPPPVGNLPQVGYVPFVIQVEDQFSPFGWQERDYVGRVLRLLDNATPNAIETELWTGAFSTNTNTGPMWQADSPNVPLNAFLCQAGWASSPGNPVGGGYKPAIDLTPTAANRGSSPTNLPSVSRGIQILEDYLANSGMGGQGMLHVTPETSPNLLGARRVGALLLSVMDNIIVPGSGYPTSGAQGPIGSSYRTPVAGSAWMFATDLVSVRLDEPMIYPTTLAEALDRGNLDVATPSLGGPNLIRVRAQRAAAATWDGARLAAVQVQLAS